MLIEDLEHISMICGRDEPSRDELRRLSATLRRILIDSDLTKVAAPRLGRILLLAPDNKPVVKSNTKNPIPFFSSGGSQVFGVWMRAALAANGAQPRKLEDFNPERTVELRLDGFLAQPVLVFLGETVSRGNVIEYVANVASGVHSGPPKEPMHHLLNRVRHAASNLPRCSHQVR